MNHYHLYFISLWVWISCMGFLYSCKPDNAKQSNSTVEKAVATDNAVPATTVDTTVYFTAISRMANGDTSGRWPVKAPLPLKDALLPFHRVVAYYGNFYVKRMGILGALPEDEMLSQLQQQCAAWQQADSLTPVIPAIHYIAVTAQGRPGAEGLYRLRMPAREIERSIALAKKINGIVFLDVQVGWSTLQQELPLLEKYLALPQVHLGIDPEFSMKTGAKPGASIGSFDAADVNYASAFLARIVKQKSLPPKILVVHRFTQRMLTNYQRIKKHPEVQLVIHMDGFGAPELKRLTYKQFVYRQPVQFTGFKVFYKNDPEYGGRLMTPAEILRLQPQPVYIQYQ